MPFKTVWFLKGGPLGIKTHTCTFVNFCYGRLSLKPRSCAQFAHGVQHLLCIFGHVNGVLRICKFAPCKFICTRVQICIRVQVVHMNFIISIQFDGRFR